MANIQGISVKNEPLLTQTTKERTYPYQVFFRFNELVAHSCFHSARLAKRLLLRKLGKEHYSKKELLGQSIAELCDSLGATFIKIGQIMSTRYDLLPQEMIIPLIKLQDRIKPFAFHHVPTIIMAQTGHPLEEIFAEFEEQPISSASIASVYRARLHNGQLVAVKIRRPDIVRKVRDDLRLMRLMARGLSRLPAMRLVPVVEMINELGRSIEQQLDLRVEAQNTRKFRENLAQDTKIRIPALIEEYCTEGILVMDFIDNLVRIDELDWEEAEYQQSLTTALKALYRMIFLDGFIHCDLHPGNLYLLKDGGAVILDTGFVATFDNNDRYQFADFFLGIATNGGKKCARIIYETASDQSSTFDREGFDQAVVDLIAKSSGSKAEAFQVATFVFQIFDIQRRFGLRGSTNFTMALLSLLVFEGLAKQLYPQLDFQGEARPFLFKALIQKGAEISSKA